MFHFNLLYMCIISSESSLTKNKPYSFLLLELSIIRIERPQFNQISKIDSFKYILYFFFGDY